MERDFVGYRSHTPCTPSQDDAKPPVQASTSPDPPNGSPLKHHSRTAILLKPPSSTRDGKKHCGERRELPRRLRLPIVIQFSDEQR